MAEIISIGTAVPQYKHSQKDVLKFMQEAYKLNNDEKRKLSFLYNRSAIDTRYSVVEDFSLPREKWTFFSREGSSFPSLNARMKKYKEEALPLALSAIKKCIEGIITHDKITHLITVSCTGMSAPGLDLEIAETLNLPEDLFRTSVNFMGCYAAVHAMKIAKMICDSEANANVIFVCDELCTLHFKEGYTTDNISSSLLFSDGAAAVLMSNNLTSKTSLHVDDFYSMVSFNGKKHMAWEIEENGFLMTLSGYIPSLVEEDINRLVNKVLLKSNVHKQDITHWCIHPGGRKILDVIQKKLSLTDAQIQFSRNSLYNYGNVSSANVLFVLKEIMSTIKENEKAKIFGVAFGPGLTMETFLVSAG